MNEHAPASRAAWTEAERLAALARYDILDTPSEAEFDDVVTLVTQVCGVPVAMVNLVAADRQWFKAVVGAGDLRETPRDASICAKVLLRPGVTVVPDLTRDPRFDCNPFVTGEPHVRFYAGALLETPDGLPLGTLCVLDVAPRPEGLTEHQAFTLKTLAHLVMTQLELRRALKDRQRYVDLIEQSPDFIGLADPDGHGVFLNAAGRRLAGLADLGAVQASTVTDYFAPDDEAPVGSTILSAVMGAEGQWRGEHRLRDQETGETTPVDANLFATRDGQGRFLGIGAVVRDITERKRDEEQRDLLVHELNHRVKNTLATVQAIASQSLRNAGSLVEARAAIESRLMALARAQDVLTRENWDGASLREIVAQALEPYRDLGHGRVKASGPDLRLAPRMALALAMALQELATNAAKYGALSNDTGKVQVDWSADAGALLPRLRLRWEEIGGPAVAEPARRGFGSRLIERSLAQDLGGETRILFAPAGVVCTVDAPVP